MKSASNFGLVENARLIGSETQGVARYEGFLRIALLNSTLIWHLIIDSRKIWVGIPIDCAERHITRIQKALGRATNARRSFRAKTRIP